MRQIPRNPKKIEIIFLLSATLSELAIQDTQTTMPLINSLLFDFARAVLDDTAAGIVAERDATNAICDLVRNQQEEIDRLKKELEQLKSQSKPQPQPQPKRTIPQDEDLASDWNYRDYRYYSTRDDDLFGTLTIWKVPKYLADIKSSQTDYHGAVEQAFGDECFGEDWGRVGKFRVRLLTEEILDEKGWQPKYDEDSDAETAEPEPSEE